MRHFFTFLFFLLAGRLLVCSQDINALKAYNNYDFIPGENILFEDNLSEAIIGEFPPRWKLIERQGVVNTEQGANYFVFTESNVGSMGKIKPRIKTASYLNDAFTVEFDFYLPEEEVIALGFELSEEESNFISIEAGEQIIKTNYFPEGIELKGQSSEIADFSATWLHAAFAYRNGQIKCYINQSRVLVIPNCEFKPVALFMMGSANVRMRNFKLADGGGMNMLDKILTDGKFTSHAINFDVNKATIRGESMGFLNELTKWLKTNNTVKLEIGGHTDSDGGDAANLALSQQRAEAVKNMLMQGGIPSERLIAKGYGESQPIASNSTPEGKSENRRVEFKKL